MEYSICKLEIFVPESHFSVVRQALWQADGGHIGRYDRCLSWSEVNSCWRPLEGTHPYDGVPGSCPRPGKLSWRSAVKRRS